MGRLRSAFSVQRSAFSERSERASERRAASGAVFRGGSEDLARHFTEGVKGNARWLRSEEVKQDALRTAERRTLNVLPFAGFGGAKEGGQDLDVANRVFQRDRLIGAFADAPGE